MPDQVITLKKMHDFLLGFSPINGKWYGNPAAISYWWRPLLRGAIESAADDKNPDSVRLDNLSSYIKHISSLAVLPGMCLHHESCKGLSDEEIIRKMIDRRV